MGSSSSNILVMLHNLFPKVAKNTAQAVATLGTALTGTVAWSMTRTAYHAWPCSYKAMCYVGTMIMSME